MVVVTLFDFLLFRDKKKSFELSYRNDMTTNVKT